MGINLKLKNYLHSSKQTFKQACERYDLVYFGNVDHHSDDYDIVRGFTLGADHSDRHYSVGSFNNRDIVLMERTTTIHFPNKPSKTYTWTLLQIDLRQRELPHLILNANQYDEILYSNLFTKFRHLRPASPGSSVDTTHNFTVYSSLYAMDNEIQLIINSTTVALSQHYAQFDYECFSEHLIVCLPTNNPSINDVENMLKAGIWLANELDTVSR